MPEETKRTAVTVSLVTATYNSGKTLARTIQSVLAQTVPCAEYTIMDGGSPPLRRGLCRKGHRVPGGVRAG